MHRLMEEFESCPIIPAVKDEAGLEKCLKMDSKIVFVLYGDICHIADIVDRIEEAGKHAIVHMDLVEGLAPREVSVDFIHRYTKASGIISTKASLIRRGKVLGLFTIFRIFMLDSRALKNTDRECRNVSPDLIEILPGVIPDVLEELNELMTVPLIAGGLIRKKEDVMAALQAGCLGISTSDEDVWSM